MTADRAHTNHSLFCDYMVPILLPKEERGTTIPAWALSPLFFPTSAEVFYTVITNSFSSSGNFFFSSAGPKTK